MLTNKIKLKKKTPNEICLLWFLSLRCFESKKKHSTVTYLRLLQNQRMWKVSITRNHTYVIAPMILWLLLPLLPLLFIRESGKKWRELNANRWQFNWCDDWVSLLWILHGFFFGMFVWEWQLNNEPNFFCSRYSEHNKTSKKKKMKKKLRNGFLATTKRKTREQTKLIGYGTDWNVEFSPGLYRKLTANMTEEEWNNKTNVEHTIQRQRRPTKAAANDSNFNVSTSFFLK